MAAVPPAEPPFNFRTKLSFGPTNQNDFSSFLSLGSTSGHERMADEFAEHLLISSLARMCRQQGWHHTTRSGISLLSEVTKRYVTSIGIHALRSASHGNEFRVMLSILRVKGRGVNGGLAS